MTSWLQPLEEGEQLVAGVIPSGALLRGRGVSERLLLQAHVGVEVDLRRLD